MGNELNNFFFGTTLLESICQMGIFFGGAA
jgi:hypothetical protein